MKRIRGLDGPPPGLSAYRAEEPNGANWDGFRAHRSRESYRELADALTDRQHGLCGYCEIEIAASRRQVEHVIPRSHPQQGKSRALDETNLIACCHGGTTRSDAGDSTYYMPPPKANMSCGQRKDNKLIPVDPRTLPELRSLMRVGPDGRIEVDKDACRVEGRAANGVGKTIELLGLNVERLRLAREERWRELEKGWEDLQGNEDLMREVARGELLPDDNDGRLSRFFTTSRSYFGPLGEAILEEEPRGWI